MESLSSFNTIVLFLFLFVWLNRREKLCMFYGVSHITVILKVTKKSLSLSLSLISALSPFLHCSVDNWGLWAPKKKMLPSPSLYKKDDSFNIAMETARTICRSGFIYMRPISRHLHLVESAQGPTYFQVFRAGAIGSAAHTLADSPPERLDWKDRLEANSFTLLNLKM